MAPLTYRLDSRELEVWVREIAAARRASPVHKPRWWERTFTFLAIATLAAIVTSGAVDEGRNRFPLMFVTAMLPVGMLLLAVGLGAHWRMRRWCAAAAENPLYGGPHSLQVDAEGVHLVGPLLRQSVSRIAVTKVSEKAGLVFIWLGADQAFAVPYRAFATPADKAAFIAEISPKDGAWPTREFGST